MGEHASQAVRRTLLAANRPRPDEMDGLEEGPETT
jgi:hypothetical protein